MSRILFVPVSGDCGSGEVQRCRLLADALHAATPDARPHFLLTACAPPVPWPVTRLPASPTRAVGDVVAAIRELRPRVVVFDGNARVATLEAARAEGAETVLVSPRPSACRRGFRLRRMARMSEHWLVGVEFLAGRCWRERLAALVHGRVRVRRFAAIHAEPAPAGPLLARLGLDRPYVVACPGGGGHRLGGDDSRSLIGRAADALTAMGITTAAVGAPSPASAVDVARLDNADLMALLAGSEAALLGGGSLLGQALALGVPVVARPFQREQAARVAWLAARGLVASTPDDDAAGLATALAGLLRDEARRARLRQSGKALGLRNGLEEAVSALGRLAGLAAADDHFTAAIALP